MTRLGRVGELGTWAISMLAWAISYDTQARLAESTGAFPGWEAWAWPATVDLASLAAMVLALDQARRGRSARTAWGIAVLSAAVMVAANTAADWPHAVAMLMHAWPPVIALACWLLLVHERRRTDAPPVEMDADMAKDMSPAPVKDMDVDEAPDMSPTPVAANGHGSRTRTYPDSEKAARVKALADERGISTRHARRILEKETLTTPLPAVPDREPDGREPSRVAARTS